MSADLKRSQSPSSAASVSGSPAARDALPAGTRFGEFEIIRVLGVGGLGIVYLAHDHSLERRVALKEYLPAALAKRGAGRSLVLRSGRLVGEHSVAETYAIGLRSFMNEARLLARFDHPSLVKVYRFWEENATAYRVMPFLQGITLQDARRSMYRSPDEAWIRRVVDPVLDALDLLHRQGVYHLDIAPENIMLPSVGPPILLDFGAARRVIGDRTRSLDAVPKPCYAPIEQYAETTGWREGPWSDLYSLGAVLHYLLFASPPEPAMARARTNEAAAMVLRQVPGVSPRMIDTVAWLLAVRPPDRPQDVTTVRAVLNGRTVAADTGQSDADHPDHATGLELAPPERSRWRNARSSREAMRRFAPGATLALLLAAGLLWQFVELLGVSRHAAAASSSRLSAHAASAPGAAVTSLVPQAPNRTAKLPATASATAAPAASAASVVPAAATVSASVGTASLPGATASAGGRAVKPAGASAVVAQASAASNSPRTRALRAARADASIVLLPADYGSAAVSDGRPAAPTADFAAAGARQTPPVPAVPVPEPASARRACGSRNFLSLALCMERECEAPRYRDDPECRSVIQMKRNREARYQ